MKEIMDSSDVFYFSSSDDFHNEDCAFVVRMSQGINGSSQVFDFFYKYLVLPGYFGFNWNALFDCLCDLHWIGEKKVIIVHYELPSLVRSEMKIYLDILHDAVIEWKAADAHSLEVIFMERDRENVENVLRGELS